MKELRKIHHRFNLSMRAFNSIVRQVSNNTLAYKSSVDCYRY
jgi:hypothetical protein